MTQFLRPLILIATVFSATIATAQIRVIDIQKASPRFSEWGILAGANFQQITAFPFKNSYNTGGVVGAYYKRNQKFFGWQTGLTISNARYSTEAGMAATPQDYDVLYANVPFIVEARTSRRFALQMGAMYQYTGFVMNSSSKEDESIKEDKLFKQHNAYLVMGFEFWMAKRLSLFAQYNLGLMSVNNGEFASFTDDWMTSSGQVAFRYRIRKYYHKLDF